MEKSIFQKKKFEKKIFRFFFGFLSKRDSTRCIFLEHFQDSQDIRRTSKDLIYRACLSQRYRYSANDNYNLPQIFLLPFMGFIDDVISTLYLDLIKFFTVPFIFEKKVNLEGEFSDIICAS